jgi:CHASE2 domain-containing sensor protein
MSDLAHTRTNIALLMAILALSASTMVWLFWHYPVITALVTVTVLAALGVSARLARSMDGTELPELQRRNQGV